MKTLTTLNFIEKQLQYQLDNDIYFNVLEIFSNDRILNYDIMRNEIVKYHKKKNKRLLKKICDISEKIINKYNIDYANKYDILKTTFCNVYLNQNNNIDSYILFQDRKNNTDLRDYCCFVLNFIKGNHYINE